MDNVDRDKIREVVENAPIVAIHREHGDAGTKIFRELCLAIKTIFNHIEPESYDGVMVVFKTLDDNNRPIREDKAKTIISAANLSQEIVGNTVIQVLSDGRLLLWNDASVQINSIAQVAVVYRYHERREHFLAGTSESEISKVGQYASIYAIPAFSDIRLALERYRTDMARESSCPILRAAWNDENQLLFANAPEESMRDSLVHFLKICVRDAETRPEQNMGASYPVDIKVTFSFSNRLALIEVKWVGTSIRPDGKMVSHHDSRAREGARQLADYLNKNRRQAPTHITRGYLVVFDGRRRKVNKNTKSVSRQEGEYYRNRDLKFDPKYEEQQDDFETPIRFFMEPILPL